MEVIKVNAEVIVGYEVIVELEGSLEEYAMNFLHIFNNVREHKELIKVKNFYGSNDVAVCCTKDALEDTVKYLSGFGHVKEQARILMYKIEEPDYNINKYNDVIVVPEFD